MDLSTNEETKSEALAKFLELKDATGIEDYADGELFHFGDKEYLILTDNEADVKTGDYIRDSLWAFRPEFLLDYMPKGLEAKDLTAIQERCEDANPAIRALVGDNEGDLIEGAIGADGRGHFLSGYDGEENEQGEYFIYRTN